ncbi:MFS transporter [Rummeliibacillus pycnus]|uniref:MFS transporter n=1 Tax=Rummeliibacillus pycnus TaxID=101070 RepID=UPI000C9A012B|nr:MFS transporter [Rummeliibacillus pycnus]
MHFNRNFYLLLMGQSIANLGDSFYIICVISLLYRITGSAALSAFVPFTITMSMFVSSILSPIGMRKWSLKSLLVSSQIGKTILLFCLSLFMIFFVTEENYFVMFLLIAGIALLDGCANPIIHSLLPYYVENHELVKANSVVDSVSQTIQIASWLFGSLLLIWMGTNILIILVATLFVISSLLFGGLTPVNNQGKQEDSSIRESLVKGWQTIRATPILKVQLIIEILETLASTVWIASILYAFVENALHASQEWWGFINGSFFIGLLLGSLYMMKNAALADDRKFFFIITGFIVTTISTILFGLTSVPITALVMSGLMGMFGQLKSIPQITIIQKSVKTEDLPTVYTSMGTVTLSIYGMMALLVGVLVDWIGVRIVFIGSGLLLFVAMMVIIKNRRLII